MTPDDMLFGEIALRLQLLTRAQIERCIRDQEERASGASLREVAIDLGLIGEVDANLIASQQARTLERREAVRRSRAPSAPVAPDAVDARARGTGERVNQRWSAPGAESDARGTGEVVNQRWSAPGGEPAVRATAERVNQRWGATNLRDEPPRSARAPEGAAGSSASGRNSTAGTLPRQPAARLPSIPIPFAPAAQGPAAFLTKAFAIAVAHGASDLHLHGAAVPMIRLDGRLVPLPGASPLTADDVRDVVATMLHASQRDVLARRGHLDFAWSAPSGRARVSAYHAQRGVDAVLRLVPARTPSLDELGLPRAVARLVGTRSGLILCTGPRGSGKSTTLAALLGATIASRAAHVITIEDPIEHLFEPSRAFVIQREVGTHTGSFARALHAALREDPDILFVSELRDAETTALAITAAETGHLVLAALPVTGTSAAVQHVVGSFPAEERDQMRARLTDSLRAVVDQRLLPRASGTGRAPAVEVAILTPALRNLIRQDRLAQWHSGLQAGRGDGMVTLDESVAELLRAGTVTAEAASRFTHRRERVGGG